MREEPQKPDLRDQAHKPGVTVTPPLSEDEPLHTRKKSQTDGSPIVAPDNRVEGQNTKM